MKTISALEYANFIMHTTLLKEQKKIIRALCKVFYEGISKKEISIRGHCGYNGHSNVYLENAKSTINNYSNYIWICVKKKQKSYWITLFYNDVDASSGNMHTQFGRIQFCDIPIAQKGRNSPNEVQKTKKVIKLWIHTDKYHDPNLWIDSPDYSPRRVAKLFKEWMGDQEKGIENADEKREQGEENGFVFCPCENCCLMLNLK